MILGSLVFWKRRVRMKLAPEVGKEKGFETVSGNPSLLLITFSVVSLTEVGEEGKEAGTFSWREWVLNKLANMAWKSPPHLERQLERKHLDSGNNQD